MNYQILLVYLSWISFKTICDASFISIEKGWINSRNLQINAKELDVQSKEDDGKNKITCRCNICIDALYCITNGACFHSYKYNQNHEKIHTQGCIDRVDDTTLQHFCRDEVNSVPVKYGRKCCTSYLCNGNSTLPYSFGDVYSTENIYLLSSICAVIFLTLVAFIMFFSCRLDVR